MTTQPEQRDARDVVERLRALVAEADECDADNDLPFDLTYTYRELRALLTLATQLPQRDGAEPVAFGYVSERGMQNIRDGNDTVAVLHARRAGYATQPVYLAPPPDERDAEIARLTMERDFVREALAALFDLYRSRRDDLTAARAQCDAFKADAERIDWIERCHTLHYAVEFLYVVDGYQTSVTCDGDTVLGPYHGETLRDSIDAARTHADVDRNATGRQRVVAIDAMRAREGENGNG